MIPSHGMAIPKLFKNGEASPSRKENRNLRIQNVTAIGTIARSPAKILPLIDCHIMF
jgi:hypothetical protein